MNFVVELGLLMRVCSDVHGGACLFGGSGKRKKYDDDDVCFIVVVLVVAWGKSMRVHGMVSVF